MSIGMHRIHQHNSFGVARVAFLWGAVFLCLTGNMQAASGRLIECYWNNMPPLVGKQISLLLPDGTHVGGAVMHVMDDGLRLSIKRSSDPFTHPQGVAWIPSAHIRDIEVRKKVAEWKSPDESELSMMGLVVGAYLGGVYGYSRRESEFGVYSGLILGGAAGTYLGGKLAGAIHPREDVDVIRIIRPASGSASMGKPPAIPDGGNGASDARRSLDRGPAIRNPQQFLAF